MKTRMAGEKMKARRDERRRRKAEGQRGGMMQQTMVPASQQTAIQAGQTYMQGVPKIGG